MPRRPNILVFLIDDLDLERIPFYSRLDAGAAAQKSSQAEGYSCKHGSANCTYAAPSIEAIGAAGVRLLGAHVPISVCTPSRYAILTGRLPSSSPFYLGHAPSAHIDELGSALLLRELAQVEGLESFLLLLENFLLLLELLDFGELALLVVLPLEPAVGCQDLQRDAGKGAAVPLLVPAVGDEGERQGAV